LLQSSNFELYKREGYTRVISTKASFTCFVFIVSIADEAQFAILMRLHHGAVLWNFMPRGTYLVDIQTFVNLEKVLQITP
jgi:hypothetical protein